MGADVFTKRHAENMHLAEDLERLALRIRHHSRARNLQQHAEPDESYFKGTRAAVVFVLRQLVQDWL